VDHARTLRRCSQQAGTRDDAAAYRTLRALRSPSARPGQSCLEWLAGSIERDLTPAEKEMLAIAAALMDRIASSQGPNEHLK
jgi:hypothetical protein